MKFFLIIGELEKHIVEYESDSFTGSFEVKVDHVEVKKYRGWFINPHTCCDLDVGRDEKLNVRFEIERKLFSGEKTRVYVNGRLLRCYTGNHVETRHEVAADCALTENS